MVSRTLHRVLAGLLVLMAVALFATHLGDLRPVGLDADGWQGLAGLVAGVGIGAVAALMGVAGGELLIPTILLLYAVDVKVAGSLSLAVSLPTMLVAFARYRRDRSFLVLRRNRQFRDRHVGGRGGRRCPAAERRPRCLAGARARARTAPLGRQGLETRLGEGARAGGVDGGGWEGEKRPAPVAP
jgi:hypothetical protein